MKQKVRYGLCYPSGSGGMFLTELLDNTTEEESGNWETNPGCRRSVRFNEYGGSVHCVQLDNSTGPLETTEQSILVAKQDIHKYLQWYDCPIVYQIDASDDDSFDYTAQLMFLKKWCGPCGLSSEVEDGIDRNFDQLQLYTVQDRGIEGNNPDKVTTCKSIDRYSRIVLKYVIDKPPVSFREFVKICYDTWMKEARENRPEEYWDKSHKRNLDFNPDAIEEHSELLVVNYADLFLYGLPTGSPWDKYPSEIQEYRVRNDKLIVTFEYEFL